MTWSLYTLETYEVLTLVSLFLLFLPPADCTPEHHMACSFSLFSLSFQDLGLRWLLHCVWERFVVMITISLINTLLCTCSVSWVSFGRLSFLRSLSIFQWIVWWYNREHKKHRYPNLKSDFPLKESIFSSAIGWLCVLTSGGLHWLANSRGDSGKHWKTLALWCLPQGVYLSCAWVHSPS